MSNFNTHRVRNAPRGSRVGRAVAVAAVASVVVLPGIDASAATSPVLRSVNVGAFSGALANHSSRTLYVLSAEKGGRIHCKTACMILWPPLEVKNSVKNITLGAHVNGKIGFIARGKIMKQVTFNSYPVYTYSGDTAARQSNGEGVVADGGTWYVANATSTSVGGTLFKAPSSSTTTTTSGGGGYGY